MGYSLMASQSQVPLTPRKTPLQARATVTVEAILEATIQVLLLVGPIRLTTTAVAERAGVSVGTMYQYFPNKEALMYAVTERHLNDVAQRVERACIEQHGAPVGAMAEALVVGYWQAKTARCYLTRAVYLVAEDVKTGALIEQFYERVEHITTAMFTTANDAHYAELKAINFTLLTSLFGSVRALFDRDITAPWAAGVEQQLICMSRAFMEAAKTPADVLAPPLTGALV